jgi:hypothetical protein
MRKSLAFICLITLLMSSTSAFAWSPSSAKVKDRNAWDNWDTAREVAYFVAHAADWGQTRSIAGHCQVGTYYETNPILGECPSVQMVNAYFLGTALVHAGVSYILPKKYRRIFQTTTFAAQLGVVSSNASIGIKMQF